MWLRFVYHVVDPALGLLDAYRTPLLLGHELVLGNQLGNVLGEHHMSGEKIKVRKREEENEGRAGFCKLQKILQVIMF